MYYQYKIISFSSKIVIVLLLNLWQMQSLEGTHCFKILYFNQRCSTSNSSFERLHKLL